MFASISSAQLDTYNVIMFCNDYSYKNCVLPKEPLSPKSTQTARTMKSTASKLIFNLSDLQFFIISIITINKR